METYFSAAIFCWILLARSHAFRLNARGSHLFLAKKRWRNAVETVNGPLAMASDSIGDADPEDFPEIDLTALAGSINVPKAPERPEEIVEDSFEGFLRGQFNALLESIGGELVSFTDFYLWRTKMGIVFDEDEMTDLYMMVIEQSGLEGLDLMNFIKINKIIDENNSAREDGDPGAW